MEDKILPKLPVIEESGFVESINKAIAKKQHADYLRSMLKQYDEYKSVFKGVLVHISRHLPPQESGMARVRVARLRDTGRIC